MEVESKPKKWKEMRCRNHRHSTKWVTNGIYVHERRRQQKIFTQTRFEWKKGPYSFFKSSKSSLSLARKPRISVPYSRSFEQVTICICLLWQLLLLSFCMRFGSDTSSVIYRNVINEDWNRGRTTANDVECEREQMRNCRKRMARQRHRRRQNGGINLILCTSKIKLR